MIHTSSPEGLSSADLMKELTANASLLLQRQVRLARLEVQEELRKGKRMASLLGAAGVAAYAGVLMLLVAAADAIGRALGARLWLGALVVAGSLLVIAAIVGAVGWSRRVRDPLPRTMREIRKEIAWASELQTT